MDKYQEAIEILRANINGYMVRSSANRALDDLEELYEKSKAYAEKSARLLQEADQIMEKLLQTTVDTDAAAVYNDDEQTFRKEENS